MGNCMRLPWSLQAETLEAIRKHEVRMVHMQYSNVPPLGHGKDARQELLNLACSRPCQAAHALLLLSFS